MNSYPKAKKPFDFLTGAQYRVLELMANGGNLKTIANKMGTTDGTVKIHNKEIIKKLGLRYFQGSKRGYMIALFHQHSEENRKTTPHPILLHQGDIEASL